MERNGDAHEPNKYNGKLKENIIEDTKFNKNNKRKPNFKEIKKLKHERAVNSLKFSKTGEYLATASSDRTIKIWNTLEQFSEVKTLTGHLDGITDISWNSYSTLLCSGSDDQTIRIWNVKTGECLKILKGHDNFVYSVAFNHQGNLIASGSFDETIKLWDVQSGKEIKTFSAHSDPVTCVSFNYDDTILLSSSYDGLTRLWDTHSGQCLKTLLLRDDNISVGFSQFSPNGKYILANSLDSIIYLIDCVSCKRVKKYKGHLNQHFCIFSCFCDEYIISGSEDHFIYVWDVQSKEILQKLSGHSNPILSVDSFVNNNMKLLASGSNDGTIIIFKDE